MKRAVTFGLALLAIAMWSRDLVSQAHAKPERGTWRYEECRFQSLQDPLWTPTEERLTLECAVGKWSVPGGVAKAQQVGACESGWNRFASNGGRYLGLFQHAASAYVARIRQYGPVAWEKDLSTSWTNSRAQVVMMTRMVHAVGWEPWTCA